jgi:hypothetical protein
MPLTLKRHEEKIGKLFDSLPLSITDLVDQDVLKSTALEAVRQSDLSGLQFVLRVVLIQLWSRHADVNSGWDPNSPIEQNTGSAAKGGDQALPGRALALTGRNPKMEERT